MPSAIRSLLFLLSSTSTLIHRTSASAGVVDINNLVNPQPQEPILSPHQNAKAQQDDENPWSHEPICASSTDFSSLGKKFCLYTSNSTGPTGVSLIMDPASALEASYFLDDNPLDNFLTRRQAERLFYHAPPYDITDVEGKGKGVVARRKIKQFETIMVDQASVVVSLKAGKAVGKEGEMKMLYQAVQQLRKPDVVRALSGKHANGAVGGEAGEGDGRLEEDIMQTNSFASEVGGTDSKALFPLVSRINHDCNPNAFVMFSRAGISMAVKAFRDIEAGEELSISYITTGQPYSKRKSHLARWGFTCSCKLCSMPLHERQQSDAQRAELATSNDKILALWNAAKYMEAIMLAEQHIDLMHKENQINTLADTYALIAKLSLESGDREKADRYAKQAFEWLWYMGFFGKEGERGEGWEEWELEGFLDMVGPKITKGVQKTKADVDGTF